VDIRSLCPLDVHALTRFFADIVADEDTTGIFHPHPFDAKTAQRICNRDGIVNDGYFAAFDGQTVLGYAMLRGWDDGYEIPSFGVCVRPDARGRGIARSLLSEALSRARTAGACRVMLKVYGENAVARRLYESMGFVFDQPALPGIQAVGIAVLKPGPTTPRDPDSSR
jgi:ribosomal-protein-alanine N-acetyltransferase